MRDLKIFAAIRFNAVKRAELRRTWRMLGLFWLCALLLWAWTLRTSW